MRKHSDASPPRSRVILRSICLALTALLLSACNLPPKFEGLVAPPEGKALVYIYKTELDKVARRDQVASYRLNDSTTRTLRSTHAHVYVVEPGSLRFANMSARNPQTHSIRIEAGESLFIAYRAIEKYHSVSHSDVGYAVKIFREHAPEVEAALAELGKSRMLYFTSNARAARSRQLAASHDSLTSLVSSALGRTPNTNAAPTPAPDATPANAGGSQDIAPAPAATPPDRHATHTEPATEPAAVPATAPAPVEAENPAQDEAQAPTPTPDLALAPIQEPTPTPSQPPAQTPALPGEKPSNEQRPSWEVIAEPNTHTEFERRKISCSEPYVLSQGCSRWSIASIKIQVNGDTLRASASSDGHVVLIRSPQSFVNSVTQIATATIANPRREKLKRAIRHIRQQLHEQGIELLRADRVLEDGRPVAYYLVSETDILSLIKNEFNTSP